MFDETATRKRSKKENSEQASRQAENVPSVRAFRELHAHRLAELEARRRQQPSPGR